MKSILVGYGYWGKIIAKYIQQSDVFELTGVCDPYLEDSLNLEDVMKKKLVQCAFVCVPVSLHYNMASRLLDHGIHVFCEKPLCRNLKETLELYQKAEKKRKLLFTDYIYTVSPSLIYIKEHLSVLGKVSYISMYIRQFGRFYKEDDVYEVLGVHMISALAFLFDAQEQEIVVSRVSTIMRNARGKADAGIIHFHFRQMQGNIECSLLSGNKERRIEIVCQNGMIVFDMMGASTVRIILHEKDGIQKKQKVLCEKWFDEKNNLHTVLEKFNAELKKKDPYSEGIALRVAEVLDQIAYLEYEAYPKGASSEWGTIVGS